MENCKKKINKHNLNIKNLSDSLININNLEEEMKINNKIKAQ